MQRFIVRKIFGWNSANSYNLFTTNFNSKSVSFFSTFHTTWLPLNSIRSMDSSTPTRFDVSTEITLTPREQELFNTLSEYVSSKSVDVVLRSAGGWVRDKLLNLESQDIDITVDKLTGEQLIVGFSKYLEEKGLSHLVSEVKINPDKSKHLETVTFKIFGYDIDVANLRHEFYPPGSRIPTIKPGTPLQDAQRRDSTINSMFYNITSKTIEDFTGQGMKDLNDGIIRTPLEPTQTFLDDPLRILRTIRFASRYRFSIVPEITESLKNPEIFKAFDEKLSRERVRMELQKILVDKNAEIGLRLFWENNLWSKVFAFPENYPQLQDKEVAQQRQRESYDLSMRACADLETIKHMKILADEFQPEEIQLLYLLTAISLPYQSYQIKKDKLMITLSNYLVLESLKFPDNKTFKICSIVSSACDAAIKFLEISKSHESGFKENFDELALLIKRQGSTWILALRIAALVSGVHEESFANLNRFIESGALSTIYNLKPLIDGKEIMTVFKLDKGGPMIGKITQNLFLWQARNQDKSKDTLVLEIQSNPAQFTS